jgi:alkylmercury lyase
MRCMTHPLAAELIERNFDPAIPGGGRPFREVVRLLAGGEPVTIARLAAAAGVSAADLERQPAWPDVEFDEQGYVIGWGLTLNPTVHSVVMDGRQLYVWCAGDTLLIPLLVDRPARIDSPCPATGTPIRFVVDPAVGVLELDPATAVIAYPATSRTRAVRDDFCTPHRFFATTEVTREWVGEHGGGRVLPVEESYEQVIRPFSERILKA